MVDQEAGSYRPRRAFTDPDLEPEPPHTQPGAGAGTNGSTPSSYLEEDVPKPLYRDEVSESPAIIAGPPIAPSDPPSASASSGT
jgi:hypothetical protein